MALSIFSLPWWALVYNTAKAPFEGAEHITSFHILVGFYSLALSSLMFNSFTRYRQDIRAAQMRPFLEKSKSIDVNYPNSRYLLYLRPFNLDHAIFLEDPRVFKTEFERTTEMEALLNNAVEENNFLLIAISEPSSTKWSGGIGLHSRWKDTISDLVSGAESFIVVPSDSEGTRWELEEIRRQDKLDQVIWFCPPINWIDEPANRNYSSRDLIAGINAVSNLVDLSDLAQNGGAFMIQTKNGTLASVNLNGALDDETVSRGLKRLLLDLGTTS